MEQNKIIFCLLVFLFSFEAFGSNGLQSGLFFSAHEVIQDKRTSLNLTPHTPFNLSDKFTIEFEANFRQDDGFYGYVFRLLGDDDVNIDLISNLASSISNFWLVYKEQTLISFKKEQLPDVDYDQWIHIQVDIQTTTSEISLSINGIKQNVQLPEVLNTHLFNLIFGAIRHSHFVSADVCPMSLRNIRILNNGKLCKYWKLSEHLYNKVYDEIENAEAEVYNPVWIIDKHVKWKKIKEFDVNNLMGSTHDRKNRRLFFVNDREMFCIDLKNGDVDTISYLKNRLYDDEHERQIIYNEYFDQIWSYDFDIDKINYFDFETKEWSEPGERTVPSRHAHQNRFISPIDSSIISILGYGHYIYSGEVHHYNKNLKLWEKIDRSDQIEPRYLSGATLINDQQAIVFGGFGNKTGRQELSPKFYYDLFYFDLNDFSFQKILTFPTPETHFVPCQSLIFDKDSNCFYTLTYNRVHHNTNLRLGRFNIDNANYFFYNDSIPYSFLDIESWTTLFLDEKESQLIAYITTGPKVEIYSIAYPPLLEQDVLQKIEKENSFLFRYWHWLIPVLLLFAGFIYYLSKRKRVEIADAFPEKTIEITPTESLVDNERNKPASIYLLGNFKIIDSAGCDITSTVTQTTTQLFLLLLMTTIKNGKGITSQELKNILWFDKDDNSARNNRNVYINKLRSILKTFEELKVINDGINQTIQGLENVFCDYERVLRLINVLKKSDTAFNKNALNELVDLALTGKLLTYVQYEWLEPYQTKYSDSLIGLMLQCAKNEEVKKDLNLLLKIADVILLHDHIDEDAISIKSYALFKMGRKNQALQAFNKFTTDYESLLATKSHLIFDDLIK